jgi:ABC-type nitrate/sulfonate/bicarbonate transport system ATPase subunit
VIELAQVGHSFVTTESRETVTTHVFEGLTLEVPELQFLAVVGQSGCGKSTLLRLIAGLLQPASGEVRVGGDAVSGPGPDRAIVFQESGLFPWRTVRANVRLGLELSGLASGAEADALVNRYLSVVGLSEWADHHPAQLSVGMRQRVGIARALAVSPSILLLDEPFAALDAITRHRLGAELLRIWEHERRTVVLVTHSIDEALLLADRVVLLRDGGVMCDVDVDLDRPRDAERTLDDPRFLELRRRLWNLL